MTRTTSALLIALSLALVLLGAQAEDVKGDGGMKKMAGFQGRPQVTVTARIAEDVKGDGGMKKTAGSQAGPQVRTSARIARHPRCRGCSPTSKHNCNVFVWYQRWKTNTGYSCSNCHSHKGMADRKCRGFDQSAEDDLDHWVLRNCGVRVNCESTRVQSSNISGRRRKRNRFILCDKCKWVDLRYTCTYDYLCTVLHS